MSLLLLDEKGAVIMDGIAGDFTNPKVSVFWFAVQICLEDWPRGLV